LCVAYIILFAFFIKFKFIKFKKLFFPNRQFFRTNVYLKLDCQIYRCFFFTITQ